MEQVGFIRIPAHIFEPRFLYPMTMSDNKIVVVYPMPTDVQAFEKLYSGEHVPMAVEKFKGKNRIVATKVQSSFDRSQPRYHRIVEIYFPTKEALETCLASKDAQDTFAHGAKISTGGKPLILIGEGETFNF